MITPRGENTHVLKRRISSLLQMQGRRGTEETGVPNNQAPCSCHSADAHSQVTTGTLKHDSLGKKMDPRQLRGIFSVKRTETIFITKFLKNLPKKDEFLNAE